jgi:single-strand DNA-binding protein
MAMEVTGKLRTIFDTKQVSERFTKRELVLELADGKYPQSVLFQLTGDRCAILDQFQVGDEVRIEFNLRGREWKSPQGEVKYFNSLDVWRIEGARDGARGRRDAGDSRRGESPPPRFADAPPRLDDEPRPRDLDDLPF